MITKALTSKQLNLQSYCENARQSISFLNVEESIFSNYELQKKTFNTASKELQ